MPAPRPAMKYISPSSYFSQVSIFSACSTGLLVGSEKLGEVVDALEVFVRAERAAQRLLDLRPQRGGMLGEAAQLLQHLQPQRPQLLLQQRVGEEAEERVGLRALLRLAERPGRGDERVDVARVAVELRHPERLELVEFLLIDQALSIVAKRQSRSPPGRNERDIVVDR